MPILVIHDRLVVRIDVKVQRVSLAVDGFVVKNIKVSKKLFVNPKFSSIPDTGDSSGSLRGDTRG